MWTEPGFSTRREFLNRSAFGIGTFALAQLLQQDRLLADTVSKPGENLPLNLKPRQPHFAPKAKAMISLFMHGGPSHVDLLDPKPELSKLNGKEYSGDIHYSFVQRANKKLFGTPWKFEKRGQCGTPVSELLPHTAKIVDDICVVRSMHTGHNGHEVSIRYFHGGIAGVTGRPTMGSWLVYGLGSEAQNLPAYMVLSDPGGHPVDGTHNWSCGFMPPLYQGTVLRPNEPRILNLDAPPHLRGELQRQNLDLLAAINRQHLQQHPGEADLEGRIASYELAAAMQTAAKEALDISQEPPMIHRMYGIDQEHTRSYGTRCLIARRLVERGVRFVQLFLGGQPWDNHENIRSGLPSICQATDQPCAALVMDLKQRGLLDSTIVHWGGEIGRLPVCEGDLNQTTGRDHNGQGFSIWLAGGGIKGGMTFGSTDEVGHKAAENVVTPNDYQATIFHLLGLDHSKLVYHHNGRAQQITDGRPARIVKEILA
ncbi:DUF1501 domain-containing protein [Tuwongella immobilis]|uniref:DUF1501 domain-containing protein n=1 Tax=Tuwongella immobilis TaxID=692036 RepID=A0A6C2YRB3_9BACT|nr:DUF1501 domain-containing protein [Tuwongella immobilis]VIP03891.1 secreted protein containing duf1501 : Uncharacterized protein OS=Planctomyces maris DSM 8797 GN=PM8797T_03254 PE=4 SV=1: DUF1501 [Tuwongella immobilis]VTS05149.1 secreted protein containing duf1501 : Uncharacterized protein OS=Planctomyces maris DSM 8797 GN=PM8797T_03254 PE=4 SV=1: DUF1501 [Tuwongella immobilis]